MMVIRNLPAAFLRGGTSKGIFLNRAHLPTHKSEWNQIFLRLMGSPDPTGRQLNGMGGGISSLSKICVVGPPTSQHQISQGVQVEYTFAQIGIRDDSVDYSGNCGNLSSMIGVFAVDEGLCKPTLSSQGKLGTVRSFNTNTNKIIDTIFPLDGQGHPVLDLPEASIAGVSGVASQIILDFVNPAGARTGKLLPSGQPVDELTITISPTQKRTVRASLVDATNPTVFVSAEDLVGLSSYPNVFDNGPFVSAEEPAGRSFFSNVFDTLPIQDFTPNEYQILENIRQAASVKMNLVPVAQAQPKIAILRPPVDDGHDIIVHALSMGVLHKAVPMTVGLCLGVATKIPGTLAHDLARPGAEFLRIKHQGGTVEVGSQTAPDGTVTSARVVRTGKRLMTGTVWL